MISLQRFLVVLSLTLLAMQGAFAHVASHLNHQPSSMHMTMVSSMPMNHAEISGGVTHATSPCCNDAACGLPGRHDHCACCASACGIHCGALLTAYRFEPRTFAASLPSPLPEPLRDGVTHAPPLKPPIG